MSINLRDKLLAALTSLPGTREFHLHVLVSSPRKHGTLFPFALPRPRAYLQDILILISEQTTPDAPRLLVTAVEACVYNLPTTKCAILYVSKVDSTGHSIGPTPTRIVVRTLLTYYGDPATRPLSADHLWIHLFARAQGQYLFPNSAEFAGKRPLSDVKLCAWWKRVLSEVAEDLVTCTKFEATLKPYYVLPGYSELEATHAMRNASSYTAPASITWTYGHPYSQTEIPLPCPARPTEGPKNLGHFIPSFEDDPKSRFIDEIAYTTDGDGVKSPTRKRSRTTSHMDVSNPKAKKSSGSNDKDSETGKDDRPLGELGRVSPDEFWERMSFRQECVAGAVTGFFALGITCASRPDDSSRSGISPLAPQPGQVSSQINKRVMTSLMTGVEFSTLERSIRGTESLEGAIKGLCEGITPAYASLPHGPRTAFQAPRDDPDNNEGTSERSSTPPPQPTLLAPPQTPPPRLGPHGKLVMTDVSPNPFPEPVTSLETYYSHIYGSVCVSNRGIPPKSTDQNTSAATQMGSAEGGSATHVTVLTARKKKKRT